MYRGPQKAVGGSSTLSWLLLELLVCLLPCVATKRLNNGLTQPSKQDNSFLLIKQSCWISCKDVGAQTTILITFLRGNGLTSGSSLCFDNLDSVSLRVFAFKSGYSQELFMGLIGYYVCKCLGKHLVLYTWRWQLLVLRWARDCSGTHCL